MSSDPTTFALDMAIDSSEQPVSSSDPIYMDYGFASYAGSGDLPLGQETPTIPLNATFQFNIAETAPNPGTLEEISISINNDNQTDPPSLPTNPFGWLSPTLLLQGDDLPKMMSPMSNVGCNILANAGWQIGPYTTQVTGTYTIQVGVQVTPNGATNKSQGFYVDPRMIVTGT
jgi:hypothetical protein